ncbi:MAG TPA: PAS domain-containing protein [bacterium]|jgi:PAS domain-containing protein
MSRFWRVVSWISGGITVVAGTLLLMGSLKNSGSQAVHLQQARLEALARLWEGRMENTRLFFHDQMVRYNVLAALDHPEDWSDWRIQNKFDAIRSTWAKEDGVLRGLVVITDDGQLHTVAGDTAGLGEASALLRRSDNADLALLGSKSGPASTLVLQYSPVALDDGRHPAHVLALIDAATILPTEGELPESWTLLATPADALMASSSPHSAVTVSAATWPLLLAEKSGAVPQSGGGTLCFVRLHIPGMEPLLLVEAVASHSAASTLLLAVLLGIGTVSLLVASTRRSPESASGPAVASKAVEEVSSSDPTGFRQIFQTVADPLCVLDNSGQFIRANRTAQDWLRLNKGKPDPEMTVLTVQSEMTVNDYLSRAVEDPAAISGLCRFTCGEASVFGVITATRLSRDEDGRGPVLIHFHPQPEQPRVADDRAYMPPPIVPAGFVAAGHDSHCPFPVLAVTAGGLITSFNDAARATCPKLEDTPLLSDVLAGVDSRDIPSLLTSESSTAFESLFGSGPHEFEIVHNGSEILLYAHRLSASKKLEVELKQAQESFYTMCALSPSPVLLVDPRDHVILEANAAAADLFGFTPVDLRGQAIDSLAAEPYDFAAADEPFVAASTTGYTTRCLLHYELIKIEGMPTLLVVLEQMQNLVVPVEESPVPEEQITEEQPVASTLPPQMPVGPGLLITMNPTVREVARRLLEKVGHPCEVFSSLDDATVWLITHSLKPELAAIDLTDFDDAENWIEDLRARCGDVPCVAFTDGGDYLLPDGGSNEYLVKPFDLESLIASLSTLHLETSNCESSQ